MTHSSNRLATIATRQKGTRLRDAIFAACVAIAATVAITTVSTACDAATPSRVASR